VYGVYVNVEEGFVEDVTPELCSGRIRCGSKGAYMRTVVNRQPYWQYWVVDGLHIALGQREELK